MTVVFVLGWLVGWILFARLHRCRVSPNHSRAARPISIIIPARDEEANLPRLLRSITGAHEIIVVDDCSNDRTREVASDEGAKIVAGTPPPAGWSGKTWACQQGANAATGEVLLFLDADTFLEPDALHTITDNFASEAVSIAPYHCVPTVREMFSAFFNLVMLAGAGPNRLLGQFLLIDRAVYQRVGGHAAVKDEVLENFALGKKLCGIARTRLGRGVVNVRMYPDGWRHMIDGWSKAFAAGAASTSPLRLAMIIVWITGCVIATTQLAFYVLFAFQLVVLLRRVGSYRTIAALLYPLPLLFFFVVFARSVFRTRADACVLWKGRPVRAV